MPTLILSKDLFVNKLYHFFHVSSFFFIVKHYGKRKSPAEFNFLTVYFHAICLKIYSEKN